MGAMTFFCQTSCGVVVKGGLVILWE